MERWLKTDWAGLFVPEMSLPEVLMMSLPEVLIRGTLVYFVRLSAYACHSKAPGGKGFVERFAGCGASGWCMP
jgi:hypothetical protein